MAGDASYESVSDLFHFDGNLTDTAIAASTLAASGNYSLNIPTIQECTVICLDDAAGTAENDLALRAIPA